MMNSIESSDPSEPVTKDIKSDDLIAGPQREVQRKLGRTILQLQQYEQLMKALIVHSEETGTIDTAHEEREKRAEKVRLATLGNLVTVASNSFIRTTSFEEESDLKESPDSIRFRMRLGIQFSPEDGALIVAELKQLVELRNKLIHHFLDQFDVFSIDGCHAASEYLDKCYATIKAAQVRLNGWAENMQQLRQEAGAYIQSESFKTALTSQLPSLTGVTDDPT
ncbi:hypothetical protein [Polaromonas sp. A23]|uniref:hypothetical protein n=1 Tax=Polaromonas sp. A23 TaxID=1944133 RepID=UPI0009879C87|nr:hypothetical protein [Polaromonas sp. A23]OOG39753.1 hypothetical protein B0B52_14065 [Polaromonas sp. A23]